VGAREDVGGYAMFVRRPGGCGRPGSSAPGRRTNIGEPPRARASEEREAAGAIHCLVTGGGVSDDGNRWHPARKGFLVPVQALANLVRGKLRAALKKRRPDLILPKATWAKLWAVDCTPWGEGDECALRYLARYVFRVAITNNRIVDLDNKCVTIRHKDRKSMEWRTTRLSGHEFMRRFLQHVLPRGLHKGSLLRALAPGSKRAS
jgi:hypothetical protein